jgi:transposase
VAKLFNRDPNGNKKRTPPDFAVVQARQEKGERLTEIWKDYRREDPHNTLSQSQFNTRLRAYIGKQPGSMKLQHDPGFKVYVDFAGFKNIPLPFYIDPQSGKVVTVQVFVGNVPASSKIFSYCVPSQKVPDVIHAHQKMLGYYGGVPLYLVCDNLKSVVIKAGRHFVFQPNFAEFMKHYGMAGNPARVRAPQDKATVETSVEIVQREIIKKLHERTHYSIEELNASMAVLLEELNQQTMEEYRTSRTERFERMERHTLQPLPADPYVYADWVHIARVPANYHVRLDGHHYSVPHALTGQSLTAKLMADRIEIFKDTVLIASHPRSFEKGMSTRDLSHFTKNHRTFLEHSLEEIHIWARKAGPHVYQFVRAQMRKEHRMTAKDACDEIKALAEKHGTKALNEAAGEAIALNALTLPTLRRALNEQAEPTGKAGRPRNRYVQPDNAKEAA